MLAITVCHTIAIPQHLTAAGKVGLSVDVMSVHEPYMKEALREAVKALDANEVPVGAVIVHQGRIIARAHNQMRTLKDATAHAEMIAITQAAAALQSERLLETTLYVTLEPCAMCAGALVLARVAAVVYGAADPKAGACGSVVNVANHAGLNHRLPVTGGVLAGDCGSLLTEFFQQKRATNGTVMN